MNQQSRTMRAVALGALVGAAAGYLFLTEQGRRLRAQIEPSMDELLREMTRLRGTVEKAREVATEGLGLLNDLTGERSASSTWAPPTRQTSPF